MKRKVVFILSTCLIALLFHSFKVTPKKPMDIYRPYLLEELELSINSLEKISLNLNNPSKMKGYYHEARKHYKHVELFVELCSPIEAKYYINGPLVPKSDPEYGIKIFHPNGFQAIEEILFENEMLETTKLQSLLHELIIELDKLKIYYATIDLEDEILLEMLQYQLYRIASLSLNGYDATITLTGIQEISWSIEGMAKLVQSFSYYNRMNKEVKNNQATILSQLKNAKNYLQNNQDYNSFDRLEFIINHINPINKTLVQHHRSMRLPWSEYRKALNLNNEFLFGQESLNMGFFSVYYTPPQHQDLKQKIGEKLFFDPVLSTDSLMSCASCHDPRLAFTDGLPTSFAINRSGEITRNAPTLLNVAFQQSFFYDGRVYQLEQQAIEVIHNTKEINGDLKKIAKKLQANEAYKTLFQEAFEGTPDANITAYAIIICLSEYERKLISLNSRFDKYLQGDETAMNQREINGYNIFAGKALCGSCHFFPVFNGTVPPLFKDTEFEVLGTPATFQNTGLDQDSGRYSITHMDMHQFAYKTPTVRNIELTAPYMHNGIYKTLEEVIEFYHKGGGVGFGFEVPNQTLPFDSLQLSVGEKEDLVWFLKSLTDTTSWK